LPRSEVARLERWNAAVLATHLESFSPDVVCWWSMGGMSLSLIEQVRRARVPAVGVVCDSWMEYAPKFDAWTASFRGRPGRWIAPVFEKRVGVPAVVELGDAAHWLFISEHTRARSAAAEGPFLQSSVAHAGIDAGLFVRGPERPSWEWRVLYCGRLEERKGVHVAVEALAGLPESATLVLEGHGEEEYVASLRALADRLGVLDRVRFQYSDRAALPGVYADADVVVFPVQWDEPWGLVPIEAMAVGRPVVATGTGGSAEYLRHATNCVLFTPHNAPYALAEAVRRLAEDGGLRARLVSAGFSTAPQYTDRIYNDRIAAALEAATLAK
jgi:glycogen synthase